MTRHLSAPAAALALAGLLAGCGGLPGSGPVTEGRALGEVLNEPVRVVAVGPLDGATQEAIVRGFLRAGEDTDETHATGKMYLAPQSVDLWRWSNEDVVIYDGDLTLRRVDDDTVEVGASVLARLTPDGVMPSWAAAAAKLFASTTRTKTEIAEKSSIGGSSSDW